MLVPERGGCCGCDCVRNVDAKRDERMVLSRADSATLLDIEVGVVVVDVIVCDHVGSRAWWVLWL